MGARAISGRMTYAGARLGSVGYAFGGTGRIKSQIMATMPKMIEITDGTAMNIVRGTNASKHPDSSLSRMSLPIDSPLSKLNKPHHAAASSPFDD